LLEDLLPKLAPGSRTTNNFQGQSQLNFSLIDCLEDQLTFEDLYRQKLLWLEDGQIIFHESNLTISHESNFEQFFHESDYSNHNYKILMNQIINESNYNTIPLMIVTKLDPTILMNQNHNFDDK
jgi:hypothetical protein